MATFSKPLFSKPLPFPEKLRQRPIILAFFIFLLLRSRTVGLTQDVIKSIRERATFQRRRKLSEEELAKVMQQVYVDEEDGSQTLLVPYRERVIKVCDVIELPIPHY